METQKQMKPQKFMPRVENRTKDPIALHSAANETNFEAPHYALFSVFIPSS
jgi:hypothetical protein